MTEVVIRLNRSKIALLIAGAVALVGTSFWIWSIAETTTDPFEVKCIAVAGILFFGICAVYGCIKLFDDKPGLVIDAEGIVDNSSAAAAGRVPWSDVTG